MDLVIGITAAGGVVAFLWSLSRDIRAMHRCVERDLRALSDRVSMIEGKLSTLLGMLRRDDGKDSDPPDVVLADGARIWKAE